MARSAPAMKTDAPADKPLTGLAKINADRKAAKVAAEQAKVNGTLAVDPKLAAASHVAHGTDPVEEAAPEGPIEGDDAAPEGPIEGDDAAPEGPIEGDDAAPEGPIMDSLLEAIHSVKPTFRQLPGQDEHAFATQMVLIVQDLPEETYDAMTPEAIAWYEEQCNKAAGRTLPEGVVFVPVGQEADPVPTPAKRGRPATAASTTPKAPAAAKPAKEKAPKAEKEPAGPRTLKKGVIYYITESVVVHGSSVTMEQTRAHLAKSGFPDVKDSTIASTLTQARMVLLIAAEKGLALA